MLIVSPGLSSTQQLPAEGENATLNSRMPPLTRVRLKNFDAPKPPPTLILNHGFSSPLANPRRTLETNTRIILKGIHGEDQP
jgi:hypothetical protein